AVMANGVNIGNHADLTSKIIGGNLCATAFRGCEILNHRKMDWKFPLRLCVLDYEPEGIAKHKRDIYADKYEKSTPHVGELNLCIETLNLRPLSLRRLALWCVFQDQPAFAWAFPRISAAIF